VVCQQHSAGEQAYDLAASGALGQQGKRAREVASLASRRVQSGFTQVNDAHAQSPARRLGHNAHHREPVQANRVVLTRTPKNRTLGQVSTEPTLAE
jgi:hypothetical protein